jgi:large subunit ribosomal protein L10
MSKQLKDMITTELKRRLEGVSDAVLVNVIGMDSLSTFQLRRELRGKNLNLLVVKSSLARRATEGTPLGKAFDGGEGSLAVVWGGEDFVSLAKEIVELKKRPQYEKLESRGGVMDGERLTPESLEEVSKWPSRTEQISLLVGQILSPGASLLSQLNAPGGRLQSQLQKKSEGAEDAPAA